MKNNNHFSKVQKEKGQNLEHNYLEKNQFEDQKESNLKNNYPNFDDLQGITNELSSNLKLKLDNSNEKKEKFQKEINKYQNEINLENNFSKMNLEGSQNFEKNNSINLKPEIIENDQNDKRKEKAERLKQLLNKVKKEDKQKELQENQPTFMKYYNDLLERNDNGEQISNNSQNINSKSQVV